MTSVLRPPASFAASPAPGAARVPPSARALSRPVAPGLPWRAARLLLRLGLVALLLLAGACSSLKLGYDEGPRLARWWLDREFDLDTRQQARLRAAIDELFAWHRREALAPLGATLGRMRAGLAGPIDAARVCGWQDELGRHADLAFEHALPALAELAATLAPRQIDRFERRAAERLADDRADWLPPDPARQRERAGKRAIDRAEDYYGRLDREQRRWLTEATAALPIGPAERLDERERRNTALAATLRRIGAGQLAPEAARAALRERWNELFMPADPARVGRHRLGKESGCELVASLHNRLAPSQRRAASERFGQWEDDVRELARQP